MKSIVRVTMDISIEHHPEVDEAYIQEAVLEAIRISRTSVCSSNEKRSYSILKTVSQQTELCGTI